MHYAWIPTRLLQRWQWHSLDSDQLADDWNLLWLSFWKDLPGSKSEDHLRQFLLWNDMVKVDYSHSMNIGMTCLKNESGLSCKLDQKDSLLWGFLVTMARCAASLKICLGSLFFFGMTMVFAHWKFYFCMHVVLLTIWTWLDGWHLPSFNLTRLLAWKSSSFQLKSSHALHIFSAYAETHLNFISADPFACFEIVFGLGTTSSSVIGFMVSSSACFTLSPYLARSFCVYWQSNSCSLWWKMMVLSTHCLTMLSHGHRPETKYSNPCIEFFFWTRK